MSKPCPHSNWHILFENTIGSATCIDCNEEVSLVILFNTLYERLTSLEKRLEGKLDE